MARIIQIPADTAATARDSRLFIEMRPSSDSFAGMAPRGKDVKRRASSIDMCSQKRTTDKFILLPTSCILKSHDRIDDSALADKVKVPVKTVSSMILVFGRKKNEKQLDDSSCKIARCSSSKKIFKPSCCDDKLPKQPLIFIECMPATSKSPKVTQRSTQTNEDRANYCIYLRSKMKKDSSYKIQPVTDSVKRPICDKKMRVSSEWAFSERGAPCCRKSKPEVTHCISPDCEFAYPDRADLKINILVFPEKDPLSQITRMNGEPEILSSSKKPLRKCKRRIYPASCCQPVRPATTRSVCSDYFHTKSSPSDAKSLSIEICAMQKRLGDQQLQRLASEQILRTKVMRIESAKSDKVSACQRSAVAFRRACFIPEKISGETSCLPSSQDLSACYKKFNIPASQLEKYRICRSKRNGLQDECIPRLLRSILQNEEQRQVLDKCIEGERNIDQLDGTSESMNHDQTEFLLCIE